MNNYKNRIKKFLTYIVCIVSLISLYACNNINSLDDSEFIIIDNNNIYGIEKKDNKFVVNSSQKREKGDFELWYYNNIFFENKDAYFTKTSTDNNLNVWIEKIDKSNFNVTRKKHTSIDTNCALLTEDKYYIVNNFITYLSIDVYDLNLNLIDTIKFEYDNNSSLYPMDLIEVDEKIYMLCGVVPNNSDFGYTENYIFKLNDQFDVIEKYDLQENNGSFFSFVYADGYLYLTHTTENINEERMALGSNEICIFDLNKKIFLEEVKILSNTYPFDIYFDENNRNLIIANGENGPTSNHVWTIYNIDTNEEIIIPIDFSEMGNDVPARSAFLEIKDDKYYLLFPSYLVEYDIQGKKSKTYNLKDLGIENAVLITAQ